LGKLGPGDVVVEDWARAIGFFLNHCRFHAAPFSHKQKSVFIIRPRYAKVNTDRLVGKGKAAYEANKTEWENEKLNA
jgi:hypothetical protein